MIKISETEVCGVSHAIRGMRNALNSWDNSDTEICMGRYSCTDCDQEGISRECAIVGPNDHKLMENLAISGTDHRKYLRAITVYMDVLAPLYWWKEFDTYKVGTVANSCSTMHKITEKEFTLDDFSYEHLCDMFCLEHMPEDPDNEHCMLGDWVPQSELEHLIDVLNMQRTLFLKNGEEKSYWWHIIQLLPSSYNQRRTIMLSYEVLSKMFYERNPHKLDEWPAFCEWIKTLPYSEIIMAIQENHND